MTADRILSLLSTEGILSEEDIAKKLQIPFIEIHIAITGMIKSGIVTSKSGLIRKASK